MSETAGQSGSADMFDRMGFHFRPILSPLSLSHAHTNSLQTHPLACISLSPLSDFLLPSPQRQHHLLVHFLSLRLPLLHTYTHTRTHTLSLGQARAHTRSCFLLQLCYPFLSLSFSSLFSFFAKHFTSRQDHSVSLIGTRHKWVLFYVRSTIPIPERIIQLTV